MPDAPEPLTDAEARVAGLIARGGVHVVHFWAPWCGNSLRELEDGWAELVAKTPEATFTFVTVWNAGVSGRGVMTAHGVPARVEEVVATGDGSHEDKAGRRRHFLGRPLTWIPSTWIFRDGGTLAFALDYGEMRMETLADLIAAAGRAW